MSAALSPAGAALLACLADPEADHAARLRALDLVQWHSLLGLALRTRSAPLLQHILAASEVQSPVASELAAAARERALRALAQMRGLAQAVRVLREAGLRPLALKGTALARLDYPRPHLRPLRDVDLLLRPDEAEAAQRLLLSRPFYRQPDWAGRYGMEHGHQLPAIEDREHGLVIELHHRLNARGWDGDSALVEQMWREAEEMEILGESLLIPSPAANLLHLVEHASLHHAFANGPLILSDLHYLCTRHMLDWPALRLRARQLRLGRPLALLAALAQAHGARWVPSGLAAGEDGVLALRDAAGCALLDDEQNHRGHSLLRRQSRRGGALARLAAPDRHELARIARQSPDSGLRWLGYPGWLAEKGALYFRTRTSRALRAESAKRARLVAWLELGEAE